MRKLKLAVPVAFVVAMAAFTAAPSAGASTVATCTSTALVQPILAPPHCTTGKVSCPQLTEGEGCRFVASSQATSLLGLAGVHERLFEVGNAADHVDAACGPHPRTCQAFYRSGFSTFPEGFEARLACDWSIAALAVLDNVTCTVSTRVGPLSE